MTLKMSDFFLRCLAILAVIAVFAQGTIVSAQSEAIAVNFSGRLDGSDTVTDVLLVESGASSAGAAGVNGTTVWNDIMATGGAGGAAGVPLVGMAGSTATLDYSATGTWSASASGNRNVAAEDASGDMKDGHIEGNIPTGISITVSGLDEFIEPYDVYLYTGHDATALRNGEFAINGGTPVPYSTAVFMGTFTVGQDYLVFTGITGDSFTLVGGGLDQDNRSGVHGLEIVGRIPEPTTMLLLALGMLAAWAARRDR